MGAEAVVFEEDLATIGAFYDFSGNFHPATRADCRFLTGLVSTFGTFDHCHYRFDFMLSSTPLSGVSHML